MHEAKQRTEEPPQQSTLRQKILDLLLVILTPTGDTAKRLEDVDEDDDIERGNQKEKNSGDARPDQATNSLKGGHFLLHKERGGGQQCAQQNHNRRVAE